MKTITDIDEINEAVSHGYAEIVPKPEDGSCMLAPCRHCGGAPILKDSETNGAGPYQVQCAKCGMRTGQSTSLNVVAATWNLGADAGRKRFDMDDLCTRQCTECSNGGVLCRRFRYLVED